MKILTNSKEKQNRTKGFNDTNISRNPKREKLIVQNLKIFSGKINPVTSSKCRLLEFITFTNRNDIKKAVVIKNYCSFKLLYIY